jgi:hypothetical protein
MSSNNLLKAALKYQSMGFSVIPVKQNKKPHTAWEKYQTERAPESQIRQWWKKWPSANIGIITGEVSGVDAIDTDSEAGWDALNEFLPDNFETPTSKTPKGRHVFFKHRQGLSNGVRVLTDCDLRTTGGYVIAPPSNNGNGKVYSWLEGLKITDVSPANMPDFLFQTLQNGSAYPASAHTRAYNKERMHSSTQGETDAKHFPGETKQSETFRNKRNIGFEEGFRDETLFHIAACLHRGRMDANNIRNTLHFIGAHCSPPFPDKDIETKLKSVFKRADKVDMGLTDQIRSFISETWGAFSVTEAKQNVTSETSHNLQPKVRSILSRIARNEKIIEPIPDKSGWYRKVESDCESENWQDACTDTVNLWLPFGLNEMALIPPGGLICVAGEPNSGKTAILLNIAKENRDNWTVHYFSSEMGPGAFKRRVANFSDVSPKDFNVKFYPRSDNFSDVIKKGEGNLNIIDYLEIYENFYRVSEYLADIYKKLDGALAIVALQKSPGQDDGRGGSFTREKPVLSLAVSPNKVKITKLKEWQGNIENPNRMEYHFKLVDGVKFMKSHGWHRPIE